MEEKTRSMIENKEIDFSMMASFLTCQQKFKYRYVDGIKPKEAAPSLSFGKAIHSALDVLCKDFSNVEGAIQAFEKDFVPSDDDKRTLDIGKWIIKNYAEKYKNQPLKLVKSEFEFSVDLFKGWKLLGRIDKIYEWDNVLWVMDHKTMSSIPRKLIHSLYPNLQLLGYVYAARKLGYDVKCVMLDAILVAKGLLNPSQRERLIPLARYDLYVEDFMMDEYLQTVERVVENIEASLEKGVYIKNFTACTYYNRCPFHQICREPENVRKIVINQDYEIEHWHPHSTETQTIQT